MARPNPNYVRAGDVIRVNISINVAWLWANSAAVSATFKNLVSNQGFRIVAFNDGAVGYYAGGALWIDVQAPNDFNNVQDVAGLIGGIAANAGFGVDGSSGQIISYVENTGAAAPAPGSLSPFQVPGARGSGGGDFLSQLGISPSTAIIAVGFIVFVLPMFVRKR
jgi:hypothetical protein